MVNLDACLPAGEACLPGACDMRVYAEGDAHAAYDICDVCMRYARCANRPPAPHSTLYLALRRPAVLQSILFALTKSVKTLSLRFNMLPPEVCAMLVEWSSVDENVEMVRTRAQRLRGTCGIHCIHSKARTRRGDGFYSRHANPAPPPLPCARCT